jgi:hypothetical protein
MWLSLLTEEQRRGLLGLAHNVVVSDGLLDPNEERMMNEFKREMDLHPRVQSDYIELDGIDRVFDTHRSRVIALLNLLRLSYVDGAFEIEEECTLMEISQAFSFSDDEFQLLNNWVKRLVALEAEALRMM